MEPGPMRNDATPDVVAGTGGTDLTKAQQAQQRLMERIEPGMDVFDAGGDKIGSVKSMRMGDPQAAGIPEAEGGQRTEDAPLLDVVRAAFAGAERLPESLQARMLHDGFIEIDGGLLGATRFALPDQIASVDQGEVRLRVGKDELIKPE